MARIVSTTSAGVPAGPDMTLDALMARQKLLQTQAGNRSANRQMISPWQGAAYLGEVLGDVVAQGRNDRQLAQGREEFAKLIAGIDPETGATPQQIAQMGLYDEDAAARAAEAAAQIVRERRARQETLADRADDRTYTAGLTADERAYNERIKSGDRAYEQQDQIADEARQAAAAEAAAIAEAERQGKEPSTTIAKAKRELQNGLITQQEYDMIVADELRPPANSGVEIEFDEDGNMIGFRQGTGVGGGKSFNTQGGKNLANAVEDYRAAAKSANDLLPTIANMEKAGDSAGYTGPGGGMYGAVDDFLESGSKFLTGEDWSLPGESGSRAILKGGGVAFVLDAVQKTKGSISDAENKLFASTAPGLEATPEGRKTLLGIAKGVAQRAIERDQEAQAWLAEKGNLDGFEQEWNDYINSNPLIVADEAGGVRLATEAPPAPVGGQDGAQAPAAPSGAPAASPAAPAAPQRYEVGHTYTFDDGTTATYNGGPENDEKSWTVKNQAGVR